MSEEEHELPLRLPTRIITCAWGEKYINELLSITLPALLAPGNLPYVASVVPCELVILTQQASFSRILGDVTVRKIRDLCGIRLIEIDDLIPSPDQYGMAITYALHRGFSDLGPSATDAWLIFLNSDFILAEGSLRSVVHHLAQGKRLVAAPSYCVKAEDAAPELLRRIDPRSRAMAIPPRDMATLVLRHRHNTIRGKTVNQAAVSIRYMDQFYWLVDPDTLLGHQMPVAIVGMRPERNLPEPNSFWDYGLVREFCPTTEHVVLGDSDDFLMMELRRDHVADGWLATGWPEPSEIAQNMLLFATPYTKDMSRHPLTLHADELPEGLDEARAKLRAFVDSVFACLPKDLPSHLEHPQFEYHWATFMESRHRYLSKRLGSATEAEEPPPSFSELDRVWWKLDGATKAHARKRAELTYLKDQQRGVIHALWTRLEADVHDRRGLANERLLRSLGAIQPDEHSRTADLNRFVQLRPHETASAGLVASAINASSWVKPLLDDLEEWNHFASHVRDKREFFAKALEFVDKYYEDRSLMLDLEFESSREQLQCDYERLLRRWARPLPVPQVISRRGPRAPGSEGRPLFRTVRRLYRQWYGSLPRVRPRHPYWSAMRHLLRLVDRAAEHGAANVLVVMGNGGVADTVADHLPGLHDQVSLTGLLEGNFGKAYHQPIKFDLCICTLGPTELSRFRDLAQAVAPYMNRDGKILGFYPNFSLQPLAANDFTTVLDLPWPVSVHYAGSVKSARVVQRFHAALSGTVGGRFSRLFRIALTLLALTPGALAANRSEAAVEASSPRLPEPFTSVTIEITV